MSSSAFYTILTNPVISLFSTTTTTNIRSIILSPSSLFSSLKISPISKLFIRGIVFPFLI